MSFVRQVVGNAAVGVGIADTPEGLSAIRHPGCATVIWRRDPLPSFQAWIDGLDPDLLPSTRTILRPDAVRDALLQICEVTETPDCVERGRLIDDAAALADLFAWLTKAPFLRLRLDVVTTTTCPRFHVDAVTARLICTYRGTGTQYGISTGGAEPERVFTVPTGAPMIVRGSRWPETPSSGLLHRSPPIEGTGETRFVLVLDPVVEMEDVPDRKLMH